MKRELNETNLWYRLPITCIKMLYCASYMASKNFDAFILILLFCILTYTHKYNYDSI